MVALRRVYWNFLLNSCLLVVLWSMRCRGSDLSLKDVSRGVNLTGVDGYVSAVADVNNDRFADLLVVKENGKKLWCSVNTWKVRYRNILVHTLLVSETALTIGTIVLLLILSRDISTPSFLRYYYMHGCHHLVRKSLFQCISFSGCQRIFVNITFEVFD